MSDRVIKTTNKTTGLLTCEPCSSNQKTRLCKNASKPFGCPFADKCHYAHSPDELRIMDCAYKKDCVFIKYTDEGKCVNKFLSNNPKVCYFRHPGEDDKEYHDRIETKKPEAGNDMTDLTPIKLELNITDDQSELWSTVVKKQRKNATQNDTSDSNPYSILETNNLTTLPNDLQVIFDYIRKMVDNRATEIRFNISYK